MREMGGESGGCAEVVANYMILLALIAKLPLCG